MLGIQVLFVRFSSLWDGCVFLLGVVLIIVFLSFKQRVHFSYENIGAYKKDRAADTLREANVLLLMAAVNASSGTNNSTIQEAVSNISAQYPRDIWRVDYFSNSSVHVSPDWGKWLRMSTNDTNQSDELASFCDLAITNKESPVIYIGLTFQNHVLELTNRPAWPSAVEWLK